QCGIEQLREGQGVGTGLLLDAEDDRKLPLGGALPPLDGLSDLNYAELADPDGNAVTDRHHGVSDVRSRSDPANSLDEKLSSPFYKKTRRGVLVGFAELLRHLGNAHLVCLELGRCEHHLVLL